MLNLKYPCAYNKLILFILKYYPSFLFYWDFVLNNIYWTGFSTCCMASFFLLVPWFPTVSCLLGCCSCHRRLGQLSRNWPFSECVQNPLFPHTLTEAVSHIQPPCDEPGAKGTGDDLHLLNWISHCFPRLTRCRVWQRGSGSKQKSQCSQLDRSKMIRGEEHSEYQTSGAANYIQSHAQ